MCVCVCVYAFLIVERSSVLKKHKYPFDNLSSILRSTVTMFPQRTLWDPLWPFFSNTDVGFFQSPLRIFHNLKDVGFLQVKVIRAEGLMAADVTGKSRCSFPFVRAYIKQHARCTPFDDWTFHFTWLDHQSK